MMDHIGPSIFRLTMLIGGTEGPVLVLTWAVVLGVIPAVFLSTGIVLPVSFQFTTGGSLKTLAALRVAPMKISLWKNTHTVYKALPLVATPSAVVWLTDGMRPWIIAGISLFVNDFCGEFPWVVSVSVIFLLFTSLV